jgi:hypothetical protein
MMTDCTSIWVQRIAVERGILSYFREFQTFRRSMKTGLEEGEARLKLFC